MYVCIYIYAYVHMYYIYIYVYLSLYIYIYTHTEEPMPPSFYFAVFLIVLNDFNVSVREFQANAKFTPQNPECCLHISNKHINCNASQLSQWDSGQAFLVLCCVVLCCDVM